MVLVFVLCAALSVGFVVYMISQALVAGSDAYTSRFTESAQANLREMLVFMPSTWLFSLKLGASFVGALVGVVLGMAMVEWWQKLIPILFFAIPAFFVPDILIKRAFEQRIRTFHMQMIDGLRIIANSLKAGLSLTDSIREMVRQLSDPIRGEFNLVLHQVDMGLPLERALENLANRIPIQDLKLFVYSVNAIASIGEGLTEICDKASELIQERFRVDRRISTLTAEGRMQSVVLCSAPVVLMIILYFIDPGLVMLLFTTFRGIVILFTVMVLNVVGFLFIRKITNIQI